MDFSWSERKRKKTLIERNLDFADTAEVFAGPTFTFEDNSFGSGKEYPHHFDASGDEA